VTVALAGALFLQVISLVILRLRLGPGWLLRPVTLLVLVSVVCDGVSQILLLEPSVAAEDNFRIGIPRALIGPAAALLSAAMLAFTVAYLFLRPERANATGADVERTRRLLDWRVFAVACAPLAVLTYEGRGFNSLLTTGAGAPGISALASEFFALLLILAAFGFLLRHGYRWFTVVVAIQSALLAAAGERTPVIGGAIALIVLCARAGARPSGRQVAGGVAVILVGFLAVSGVRAAQGRDIYYTSSGFRNRTAAAASGFETAVAGDWGRLLAQDAARTDGTSFTAAILEARDLGHSSLPWTDVPESLLLAIPSVIWQSKLSSGNLDPALTEINDFGLHKVNFLPGLPGLYVGYLTPMWLLVFLAAAGIGAGAGERWLLRRVTAARLVLLAGSVTAAMAFQQGLPGMLVQLRAAIAVAIIIKGAELVRNRRGTRQGAAPAEGRFAAAQP
jgi:hypothetical protein